MRLISLSPEYLESEEVLPFDVFDAEGNLLLHARQSLQDRTTRTTLRTRGIYADSRSVADWRRRLTARVDALVRGNETLAVIAKARAEPRRQAEESSRPGEEWEALVHLLDAALRQSEPEQPWVERVLEVQARVRALTAQRMDEALFHYVYNGARHAEHYSSHQALRCMLIAGEVARELGWDAADIVVLERAALTMNVGMRRLQDRLALMVAPKLDDNVRKLIARHSEDGAQQLLNSGVAEPDWIEAVRHHHDAALESLPYERLSTGQRLALLLRRVDIYCAKISRRAGRAPLTAMQAAGQSCLGPDGRPDRIGAALLKALGLYPPGCFVQLASGETGIVLARGARANHPLVAALVNARGQALMSPLLRDSAQPGLTVRAALRPDQVPVQPSMPALRQLRMALRS
ncbi:HD-GYP domain-containing protein [Azohydromonas aeria]|uniref:HD-GYP domain-containing protein n=1 Tax=Azohydromonas aeria TaxID=2590212 RepID=UPI0012F85A52|nr:hypothetical protein [Azohydromonas aeria]